MINEGKVSFDKAMFHNVPLRQSEEEIAERARYVDRARKNHQTADAADNIRKRG